MNQPKEQFKNRWREFLELIFLVFTLALFLRTFFLGFYRVTTGSMAPTLRLGDFVMGFKSSYGIKIPFTKIHIFDSLPKRGELVLYSQKDNSYTFRIKRVIGLPGDQIIIKNKQVLVNGTAIKNEETVLQKDFSDIAGSEFMSFMKETAQDKVYFVAKLKDNNSQMDVGPIVIPPGELFLLSDYRENMDDAHYWDRISISSVESRIAYIWFSVDWSLALENGNPRIRWDRIGNIN